MQTSFLDIQAARQLLSQHLPVTPLTFSEELGRALGRQIWVKWDNKFRTGSFKERGAANFLLKLKTTNTNAKVCAASAGNHALAVAWHSKQLNIPCTIIMPRFAPLVKVKTASRFGAKIILSGDTFDEAYSEAQKLSTETGSIFLPGFDHTDIISGQGVSGLEILEQTNQQVDAIVVPIGGGGLAAGIALAAKTVKPDIFILGVRSEWVKESHTHKGIFPPAPIADGIAVKKIGALPEAIINQFVDCIVYVSEQEIAKAVVDYLNYEHTVVEGAGAASLAAVRMGFLPAKYKYPVLEVCGSNIDLNVLARLIQRSQFQDGQLLRVSVSVPDRPGSLAKLTASISEARANVLETYHERSCSIHPGNVDITFLLETRDSIHKKEILQTLSTMGLNPQEL